MLKVKKLTDNNTEYNINLITQFLCNNVIESCTFMHDNNRCVVLFLTKGATNPNLATHIQYCTVNDGHNDCRKKNKKIIQTMLCKI